MTFAYPTQIATLNNYDPAQIQRRVDINPNPTFVGNTIASVVPGHELWHPLIVRFTVTASAAVASRFPRLTYIMQGGTFPITSGNALTASNTMSIVYFIGLPFPVNEGVGTVTTFTLGMPDLWLGPGDRLQLVVNQIQAGDTCTLFQVVNEVMLTEPNAPPGWGQSAADRMADAEHVLEMQTMPGIR